MTSSMIDKANQLIYAVELEAISEMKNIITTSEPGVMRAHYSGDLLIHRYSKQSLCKSDDSKDTPR
jgi:hypothetical protein